MAENRSTPARARWARFRFGVIAPLLTAPPEPGELAAEHRRPGRAFLAAPDHRRGHAL